MEENNIESKIQVKNKEIQVELNPNKKVELQRDLEILNLRKQIKAIQDKIKLKLKY